MRREAATLGVWHMVEASPAILARSLLVVDGQPLETPAPPELPTIS